jgi:hypothetical protein
MTEEIKLPADGSAWKHPDTDLRIPQKLGSLELKKALRGSTPELGMMLTFVDAETNVKADMLLAPCPKEILNAKELMPAVVASFKQSVIEIQGSAASMGYQIVPGKGEPLKEGIMKLWKMGEIPAVEQVVEYAPSADGKKAGLTPINQLINVVIYQDTWIQTNVIVTTPVTVDASKAREEFLTQMAQVIRQPAINVEMLKLCHDYAADPLKKESQDNADSLLAYSQTSPVFEITMPGEAITRGLAELEASAPGTEKDVLRGYLVGSAAKVLMGDPTEAQLEEGARIMCVVYKLLKEKNPAAKSPLLDELAAAVAEKKGAQWISRRMNSPLTR